MYTCAYTVRSLSPLSPAGESGESGPTTRCSCTPRSTTRAEHPHFRDRPGREKMHGFVAEFGPCNYLPEPRQSRFRGGVAEISSSTTSGIRGVWDPSVHDGSVAHAYGSEVWGQGSARGTDLQHIQKRTDPWSSYLRWKVCVSTDPW